MKSAKDINVQDIQIEGKIIENKTEKNEHYTKIRLLITTYLVEQYFSDIETKKRDSIFTWLANKRFKWELQEDLPISFDPNKKSVKILKYEEPIGINVFINGEKLYRNELPEIILEQGEEDLEGLSCKYVFATNYQSIKPLEARGIKIRVNNVGIGKRTDFDLRRDRGFSRLHWIAGEIHISSEAREYLSISRDSFITSPIIDSVLDAYASKLRDLAYYVEDVAVAEKSIEQTFIKSKKEKVKPKKQQLESSIETLRKKGFEIVDNPQSNGKTVPVIIDKKEKKVYLTDLDTATNELDKIEVLDQNYFVEYSWDFKDNYIPCRMEANKIIINAKYPLYKSNTYGAVFKKFHILLLVASSKTADSKKVYRNIIKNFLKEFNEFIG
jgi:hypothetical protein